MSWFPWLKSVSVQERQIKELIDDDDQQEDEETRVRDKMYEEVTQNLCHPMFADMQHSQR
jgi:hypothetical protein